MKQNFDLKNYLSSTLLDFSKMVRSWLAGFLILFGVASPLYFGYLQKAMSAHIDMDSPGTRAIYAQALAHDSWMESANHFLHKDNLAKDILALFYILLLGFFDL